jgi:hypothetical protein
MIRTVYVALLAATLTACAQAPASLLAPANPHAGLHTSPNVVLLAGARRDEIQEPADWQQLNEQVTPKGGHRAH